MSPRPMALETAINMPASRISVMDVDEIAKLYMQTVKVLKKIEEREAVILAEHWINRPRKRAYTLHDNDVSFSRIFVVCNTDCISVRICHTSQRHAQEPAFYRKLSR